MLFLLFCACADPSWPPRFYDYAYYRTGLGFWEDDDGDGQTEADGDCDDGSPTVFENAEETCNTLDDDCDDQIDEDALDADPWYRDDDGDGYGQEAVMYLRCEQPTGYSLAYGDCDDEDPEVYDAAIEVCGEPRDLNCDGITGDQDDDADTWMVCEGDCDDANRDVFPGAWETCNGYDDDCDGETDGRHAWGAKEWRSDGDDDGYGAGYIITQCDQPGGWVSGDEDCDDTNPDVNPGVEAEICGNGVDDDCDGSPEGCRLEDEVTVTDQLVLFDDEQMGPRLGAGLLAVDDLTGDGSPDILVGAPAYGQPGTGDPGRVFLVAGPIKGEVDIESVTVAEIEGSSEEGLGHGLASVGDVNSNGTPDWAIRVYHADGADDDAGAFYVVPASTASGPVSLLASAFVYGTTDYGEFGARFEAPGDLAGDGEPDLIVGAPGDSLLGDRAGAVYGFAHLTETRADTDAEWTIAGEELSLFGYSAVAADWNGDGTTDLAVGAGMEDDYQGAAYVFEGPFAGSLTVADHGARIAGEPRSALGFSAVNAGDTNLDGLDDLWVNADLGSLQNPEAGDVYLFTNLGASGDALTLATAIFTGEAQYDTLGYAMDAGDLDLDGVPDLLLGSPASSAGAEYGGKVWLEYGPFAGRNAVYLADAWWVGRDDRAYGGEIVEILGDFDLDGNVDFAFPMPDSADVHDRVNFVYGYSF